MDIDWISSFSSAYILFVFAWLDNNNNNIYFSIVHMSLRLKALNNKRLQFKI